MTITAKLQKANIRTDDFYHMDGILGFCCHDMLTFGSAGATVASTYGRYAWVFSADHPAVYPGIDPGGGWQFGQNIVVGFSNDPGRPPETTQILCPFWFQSADTLAGGDAYIYYHYNDLVYNPDDATYPFYLYCEGAKFPNRPGAAQHECGLLRSTNMIDWVGYGGSHVGSTNGYSSFQLVKRLGAGNWISMGQNDIAKIYKWTSTDALTWTVGGSQLTRALGGSTYNQMGSFIIVNDGGQDYMLMGEDARVGGVGGTGSGQFATLVAIDSNYNLISSPAQQRLTPSYAGFYPGFTFLQSACPYVEDGILHFWVQRGYFPDDVPTGVPECQHMNTFDYYTAIIDATAAASAAPVGVTAECRYGAVILSWYDALPAKTYRIYRSTDGTTWGTAIASSVTGLQYVDTSGTLNTLYYYKVVTMNAGTEQTTKYRVVKTYVSNGRDLTNRHCTRVFDVGGATALATVNVAWLDTVVGWLHDNALTDHCLYWADPSFGYTVSSGTTINKVFCLGSTINPRGGDYVPCTSTGTASTLTTYSATGLNSTVPAWVNSTSGAFGRFDKLDPIRRKVEGTFVAVYQKPGSAVATFLDWLEGAFIFQHTAAGNVELTFFRQDSITPDDYHVIATKSVASHTAAHIAIGVMDGLNPLVYVDGVVGGAATDILGSGIADTYLLDGFRAGTGGGSAWVVGAGSSAIRGFLFSVTPIYPSPQSTATCLAASSYLFNNNEALYSASTLAILDIGLSDWQAKSLNTFLSNRITGTSYSLPSYSTPFVKSITDAAYGATGTGTGHDDAAAFAAFRTAALAWQTTPNTGLVVLQVPAGTYYVSANVVPPSNQLFSGITRFLLLGEHRDTTSLGMLGVAGNPPHGFIPGSGFHLTNNPNHSARIATVAAGSTSITLVTASKGSLFTAGKLVFISGIDLQGFGFPPNPHQFEWRRISSITGSVGSPPVVLNLTEPLEYGYKSTWPAYNDGTVNGEINQGGPGTVYQINDVWDCEHEYRNFTNNQRDSATKAVARFMTLKECACSDTANFFSSDNYHFIADNLFQPGSAGSMEVDKCIGVATIKGGSHRKIHCQSSSPMRLEINGACLIGQLQGCGRRLYMDGFYVSTAGGWSFGPSSFGSCDKVVVLNGTAPAITFGSSGESDLVAHGYTMVSGTLTAPKSLIGSGLTWVTPGGKCLFRAVAGTVASFNIIDYTESGSNVIITTDWASGFPAVSGNILAMSHPAPNFTMRGVASLDHDYSTGTYKQNRDLSRVLKPCQPLYSRSRKFHTGTYNGSTIPNINDAPNFEAFGKIVRFVINVTTAYTGPTTPLLWHVFSFAAGNIVYPSGAISPFWDPQIDLRTAGTRILTAGAPLSGPFGLDANLTPPSNPLWMAGPFGQTLATNIRADGSVPVVEVTVWLDQSPMAMTDAVPVATASRRFRYVAFEMS